MKDFAVGSITFGVKQLEGHFDAIRNRVTDALLFEEMYYKAEYENEKLRERIMEMQKVLDKLGIKSQKNIIKEMDARRKK
jgi:uncharacterized protein with von Willebrand factor type A (vWA) domain